MKTKGEFDRRGALHVQHFLSSALAGYCFDNDCVI